MEQSRSAGPVQIVSITEDHKFVLDEKKLKEILYHRRAQGKKVPEPVNTLPANLVDLYRSHSFPLRATSARANPSCWTFFFDT